MKHTSGLLLFFLLLLAACNADHRPGTNESAISTYILVRHAEKDTIGSDPSLSEVGRERAVVMRDLLAESDINHIFTSDYRRTRQTAAVVSERHQAPTDLYDAGQLDAFAEMLQTDYAGKTVLIVGHSNTTPALMNILTRSSAYQALPDSAYGDIFVLTIQGAQSQMLQLRAGR